MINEPTVQMMKGVIQVTGEHDTGKTTFALECGAQPEKICFLDDDVKGRATVEDCQGRWATKDRYFGAYHDLVALGKGRKMLDFHKDCLEIIETIEPGQFDVIIWDTWSGFLRTCGIYAKTYPNEFRDPSQWSSMGRIKGAEQNKAGTLYEAAIIGQLTRLAPLVILVTHLKDMYAANSAKVEGKQIPDSGKTLARVPRARIWLRQNPDGRPVPIGLFLKRFDRKVITDRGLRTECIVPRKIVPAEGDRSLWDTVWRYWENPVGNRRPTLEETPNKFELSILDGTLTEDQRRTLDLMLKAGIVDNGKDDEPMPRSAPQPKQKSNKDRILELAGSMTPEEIAKEIGRPLAIVKSVLGGVE